MQPHLLAVMSPIKTALLIGTIWCFWHIPLSFTPGTTPVLDSVLSWMLYLMSGISTSALILVIVIKGRGSIGVAMAFHWASNVALTRVIMPLYPHAKPETWADVELLMLALSIAVAVTCLAWLYFDKNKGSQFHQRDV